MMKRVVFDGPMFKWVTKHVCIMALLRFQTVGADFQTCNKRVYEISIFVKNEGLKFSLIICNLRLRCTHTNKVPGM